LINFQRPEELASPISVATRAFVEVLLALAHTYELALQVNKESSPEQLVKAYKKVFRKAHPTTLSMKLFIAFVQIRILIYIPRL